MSDLPRLHFREVPALDDVAERESRTIPRVGESVWLRGASYVVSDIEYLYPDVGSFDYNAGRREPLVYVGVVGGDE